MAVDLLTLIPSTRTRSINFFNGRLLAGEDLTTEQQSNRAAHALLGQAIGDGVAYGLEVSISTLSSTAALPVLKITSGLAINKNGGALTLEKDVEVALVRSGNGSAATATPIFQDCTPPQAGPYVAGAGCYVLTVGPGNAPQGLAEVSGLDNTQAPCNSKYNLQGVQFRNIPILQNVTLPDQNHIRNFIAYQCFGVTDQDQFFADPFGSDLTTYGLMDQLRASQMLTNCEVPLAVMYWTSDSGVVFVDMWSVRRRATCPSSSSRWPTLTSARRLSEAEAEFLQFEDQMQWILAQASNPASVSVDDQFDLLPAAGILPIVGKGSSTGFDPATFFGAHASQDIATTNGNLIRELFRDALNEEPIRLSATGKIQLYLIWENLQAVTQGTSAQLVLVFATPALRYRGIARFGFARTSVGRFAPRVI